MLNREDWHMIEQMLQRGCYQTDIAAALGCSERTVRRALQRQGPPAKRPTKRGPSKLDPFKPLVDRLLSEQVWNAAVILAEIRAQGYTGAGTMLRMYVQPKRALRASKATVRFETDPGWQLQHDWGELFTEVAGQRQKVYVAVNTLGFSRRFHAWAAPKLDAEHTYESLVRAFEAFGGVPREVLVDNQKPAVILHSTQALVFTPGFLELASHYGFQAKACKPARPRTKGKTERMVGYVKHHFFQRYRQFESLVHLNQLLEQWLTQVADRRCHGTVNEIVADRFAREQEVLQPLPPHRFDTSYLESRWVAWDSHIDVQGNRYSVPAAYCGQPVTVRRSLDGWLRICNNQGVCIAEHRQRSRAEGWQVEPTHLEALWQSVARVEVRDLVRYEEVL